MVLYQPARFTDWEGWGAVNNTIELIERYYDLLAARDRDGLAEVLSEDIVVTYWGQEGQLPWAGTFAGLDGFWTFLASVSEHLDIVEVERLRVVSDTEAVIIPCRGQWRVKATGEVVHAGMVNVFVVTDGRISAYDLYVDTAAFVAALGKRQATG